MHLTAVSINQSNLQYKRNKNKLPYQSVPSFKAVKGLGPDVGKNIQELAALLEQNEKLIPHFKMKLDALNVQFAQINKIKKKLQPKAHLNLKEELAKLTQEIKSAVGLSESADAAKKVEETDVSKNTMRKYKHVKGFGMGKIAGYEETKNILNEYFISKIKLEKQGQNVDIPNAFFFFGPKGNGKTTSAMAIAEETGCNVEKLEHNYFQETAQEFFDRVLKIAENAKNNFKEKGRTIIFSDEFTTYMSPEDDIKERLLEFLKDCSQKYKCTFFGTTNHLSQAGEEIKSINPVIVSFDPPSKRDMAEVLKYYVNGKEAEPINYYKLAGEMQEWAKEQNGTLNNSHINKIITGANLSLYTAKDILNFTKTKFDKTLLLNEDILKNYREDFQKFIID